MLMQAQRGGGVIGPAIRNMDSRSGWEFSTTPRPFYPLEKPGTHLQDLCGSRGQSGRARRISPHQDQIPGPASPQRVALPTMLSHYTLLNENILGRVLGNMCMALRFMWDVASAGETICRPRVVSDESQGNTSDIHVCPHTIVPLPKYQIKVSICNFIVGQNIM